MRDCKFMLQIWSSQKSFYLKLSFSYLDIEEEINWQNVDSFIQQQWYGPQQEPSRVQGGQDGVEGQDGAARQAQRPRLRLPGRWSGNSVLNEPVKNPFF